MCHTNRKKSLRSLARERSKERIAAAAHGGGVVVPDVAIDGVVIGGCSSASDSRSLIATVKAVGFLRSSSQRRLASDEASQGVGLLLLIS